MFKYWLQVPQFADSERQYKAQIINIGLRIAAIVTLIITVILLVEAKNFLYVFLPQALYILLIITLGYIHLSRGNVELAAKIVIFGAWVLVPIGLIWLRGYNNFSYMSYALLLSAAAALLLPWPGLILILGLSFGVFVIGQLAILNTFPQIQIDLTLPQSIKVLSNIANFAMIVSLFYLTGRVVGKSFSSVKRSELYYNALFEQNNDAIILFSLDSIILAVNQRAQNLLGYREEELVGKPTGIILIPEETENNIEKRRLLLAGKGIPVYERTAVTKHGEHILMEVNLTLVRNSNGSPECFQVIGRDITYRESVRRRVERSEARFRSLFEESPISLWEEDFSEVKQYIDEILARGVDDLNQYFLDHPEEVEECASRVKILTINQATHEHLNWLSKETLLEGSKLVYYEEGRRLMREEFVAFAQGQTRFESETFHQNDEHIILYTFVRASIPNGFEDTWERVFISVMDITGLKEAQRELKNSELQYRTTIESMEEAIMVVDRELRVTLFNNPYTHWNEAFDINDNCVGMHAFDIFPFLPDDSKGCYADVFETGEPQTNEEAFEIDGTEYHVEMRIIPVVDQNEVVQAITVIHDVTEQHNLEQRLRVSLAHMAKLSRTDPLTQLFNRRAIIEYAQAELSRAARNNNPLSLLLLDMDLLKQVNDKYGHQYGDEALRLLAQTLDQAKRKYDWAGRWGGDEFLLVLPDAGVKEAIEVATRLNSRVRELTLSIPNGHQEKLSISMGISCTDIGEKPNFDLDELISQADEALYKAKENGRDRYAVYDSTEITDSPNR